MPQPKNKYISGFTLLELLIALVLSLMIAVAALELYTSVSMVTKDSYSREEASSARKIVAGLLAEDLGSLYFMPESDFSFTGKGSSSFGLDGALLEFTTTATIAKKQKGEAIGLYKVQYRLSGNSADEKGRTLLRRERPWQGLKGEWPWLDVPVLEHIEQVETEYYDTKTSQYVTEWPLTKKTLPGAVRIHISYTQDAPQAGKQTFIIPVPALMMPESSLEEKKENE